MKKDWEPSILAVLASGFVVALVILLFVQQAQIAKLEVRVEFLETTLDVGLTTLEEKTDQAIHLIRLADYERERASAQD